ncbi:type VI secretion system tip protein VgrG [Pseudomonas viridiflava]|uniref:type VI secretion system Vgr family protein n=1 Tax=Pseudomonas viridiflava TaxID=33069 RepID=UPI000F057BBC|nr:type VI secretion system tip protein VgrG [Pseudomonas viridiflava]
MLNSKRSAANIFTLKLPSIENDFQVLEFEGGECISQPYEIRIDLVSENPNLPLARFLHRTAFLCIGADGTGIHGQIHSISQHERGKRLTRYSVTLVPQLAYLQHRFNQRIFQQKSVPQIVAQVLEEHQILLGDYRFAFGPTLYPAREYCTQFNESDLNFIQRLCAAEGIHYHFEHSEARHVLVFGDDQTGFAKLPPNLFNADTGLVPAQATIKQFNVRLETRTSRVSRRDYNFEQPTRQMESGYRGDHPEAGKDEPDLEDYAFPGDYADDDRARLLVRRALERHRSDYQLASGSSDVTQLRSGHFLDLKQHPSADNNMLWLLTRVSHHGKQPQVMEEFAAQQNLRQQGFTQGYQNTFEATPWQVHFRPPFTHRTPSVKGSQSAIVTGPAGEEIHCDEHGRVKVQFHWDREGRADDHTSCWMRVASSWAGDAYGSTVIPRVGMEVAVSFWEGCPDKPYISGCVVNARNIAPYPLPANKSQSVFKTLSYPGGEGSNELRIEDRKGAEKIFIQAERDWEHVIKHDQTTLVGNERHDTVIANSYSELRAEEHRTTQASRMTKVGATDHLDIGQSQHVKTAIGQYVDAGQEIHLKAGCKVVIEAGAELTLSAGGSTLTLNPGGVWLNGAVVASNIPMAIGGAAAAVGSGVQVMAAGLPGAVVAGLPGAVPKQALANIESRPGTGRCLICEARRAQANRA